MAIGVLGRDDIRLQIRFGVAGGGGGVDIPESSQYGFYVSQRTGASLSSAQDIYGGESMYFDGVSGNLSIYAGSPSVGFPSESELPSDGKLNPVDGSGNPLDFQFGVWVFPTNSSAGSLIGSDLLQGIACRGDLGLGWGWIISANLFLKNMAPSLRVDDHIGTAIEITASNPIPLNEWSYIEFLRSGNEISLFVKSGDAETTASSVGSSTFSSNVADFTYWTFGADGANSCRFEGYMQGITYAIGTIEHDSAFTPLSTPRPIYWQTWDADTSSIPVEFVDADYLEYFSADTSRIPVAIDSAVLVNKFNADTTSAGVLFGKSSMIFHANTMTVPVQFGGTARLDIFEADSPPVAVTFGAASRLFDADTLSVAVEFGSPVISINKTSGIIGSIFHADTAPTPVQFGVAIAGYSTAFNADTLSAPVAFGLTSWAHGGLVDTLAVPVEFGAAVNEMVFSADTALVPVQFGAVRMASVNEVDTLPVQVKFGAAACKLSSTHLADSPDASVQFGTSAFVPSFRPDTMPIRVVFGRAVLARAAC